MTIKVSTTSFNSAIPSSACFILRFPSNGNGFVTTPTVRAPVSFAIRDITGAAPVPVPPPIPAVMKTMSEPSNISRIIFSLSSAAFLPVSGLEPAPSPRVNSAPIWTFPGHSDLSRDCTSVFAIINSTPRILSATIEFTALEPPPPTPTTFIIAE